MTRHRAMIVSFTGNIEKEIRVEGAPEYVEQPYLPLDGPMRTTRYRLRLPVRPFIAGEPILFYDEVIEP